MIGLYFLYEFVRFQLDLSELGGYIVVGIGWVLFEFVRIPWISLEFIRIHLVLEFVGSC